MNKRLIAVLMAAIMTILTGCRISYAIPEVSENPDTDETVMTPWINSNIIGAVGWDVTESYKDDFYYAVNHDWLRDTRPGPGETSTANIVGGKKIVKKRCMEFLNDKSLSGSDADLIRNFYELFLDWDSRNDAGIEPVEPFLAKLMSINSLDEMTKFMLSEENHRLGDIIITPGVDVSPTDSSVYEVTIPVPALLLTDPAEYVNMTANGEREKAYVEGCASYMMTRLGMTEKDQNKILEQAFDLDTKIAAFEKTALEKADTSYVSDSVNIVTFEELKELSPDFPLPAYMEKYGWSEAKLIDVAEPDAVRGFNSLYTKENLEGIKAKLLVQFSGSLISLLDEQAYRKYQELNNKKNGIAESAPDEEAAYLKTKKTFPDSFARLYIDRYLNENIRQEITKLCKDCIETYDEMLAENDWLTDETVKAARDKLSKVRIHAVYPDKWEDYSVYSVKPAKSGGNYFDAVMDNKEATEKKNISKINTKKDDEIWVVDVLDTNCYYDRSDNSINILPGFFCDYTYSEDMKLEQKYGALGAVIGHEISHAFDTKGSQYDGDGNLRDWWTQEDKDAFRERTDKLIEFYDRVVPLDDGSEYHGTLIQTEAIADLAGFKCMLKMAEEEENFDYDLFFKTYERLYAEVSSKERIVKMIHKRGHPLTYLRGNVTVQQFDEFMETYGIKEGDGMYLAPEDRIAVW
ncbi:MAG: M13 family metallopeptidase [Lachnospiraceae bacterium]|nr:M13 family metallopeptidase [Lachnospiraceae bacterium]